MAARDPQTLCFVTWNTRGLQSTKSCPHKTESILKHLTALGADVAFLQETHIGLDDTQALEEMGSWRVYLTVYDSLRKGVAILIKNDVDHEYIGHEEDCDGSYLVVTCRMHNQLYTLVSVYNHQTDRQVLLKLTEYLQEMATGVLVIGGDFNTVLHPVLDRTSLSHNAHHSVLRRCVKKIAARLHLVDIWREQNPSMRAYTHYDPKTKGQSRIDFFLIPQEAVSSVHSCQIDSVPPGISDHDPVSLRLFSASPEKPCFSLQLHGMIPPPQLATPLICLWLQQKHRALLSWESPSERRVGRISGTEILKALRCLMDYGNPAPDGVPVCFYQKACRWMLTSHLKALYNKMLDGGFFTDSFNDAIVLTQNGSHHHCFNVDYLIFATVVARRLEKHLELVAKKDSKLLGGNNSLVISFMEGPKRVRWSFLVRALQTQGQRAHPVTRIICVLEKLLQDTEGPDEGSSDHYKQLCQGCPLTPALLSMCMKNLAEQLRSCDSTTELGVQTELSYPHKIVIVTKGTTGLFKCQLSALLEKFSMESGLVVTAATKEAGDPVVEVDEQQGKLEIQTAST